MALRENMVYYSLFGLTYLSTLIIPFGLHYHLKSAMKQETGGPCPLWQNLAQRWLC